jgi:hypothetical protein
MTKGTKINTEFNPKKVKLINKSETVFVNKKEKQIRTLYV